MASHRPNVVVVAVNGAVLTIHHTNSDATRAVVGLEVRLKINQLTLIKKIKSLARFQSTTTGIKRLAAATVASWTTAARAKSERLAT